MFDRSGSKIQLLAKILFWLGMVGTIILALVFSLRVETHYGSDRVKFNAVLFFPILIYGGIASYISSLFLYGFGEIIDQLESIDRRLLNTEQHIQKLEYIANTLQVNSAAQNSNAKPSTAVGKELQTKVATNEPKQQIPIRYSTGSHRICANCGYRCPETGNCPQCGGSHIYFD